MELVTHLDRPPERVVSLVPSLTESLFDLGLGEALVGITDYCVHPAEKVEGLPRVGGPKDPRIEAILDLGPDLVLVNREENTRRTVEALQASGITAWVSFPRTVREAIEVLWKAAELFRSPTATARVQQLERTVDWVEAAGAGKELRSYFCPIWQGETGDGERWWMTFNRHTYIQDLLRLLGGKNVFADRERRYPLLADMGKAAVEPPGERDTRYPRVTLGEILAAQPEIILLMTEPYTFKESHVPEFTELLDETPAAQEGQIQLVDGSLLTWHGTRLARALQELSNLFD
jgi:ABC-type Fe3+-hydroxamate transport system substrate-binding protein